VANAGNAGDVAGNMVIRGLRESLPAVIVEALLAPYGVELNASDMLGSDTTDNVMDLMSCFDQQWRVGEWSVAGCVDLDGGFEFSPNVSESIHSL